MVKKFTYNPVKFKYNVKEDGTLEIREFNRIKSKDVVIPRYIDSYLVTSIRTRAFSYKGLVSVTIPESVAILAGFRGNHLTEVAIPESVKRIVDESFSGNRIKNITIPESVTRIGDNAFSRNQLKEIHIPDSVTHISKNAFQDNQLEMVVIGENVESIGNGAFSKQNGKLKRVIILGDQKRFNDKWTKIGFPKRQMPV